MRISEEMAFWSIGLIVDAVGISMKRFAAPRVDGEAHYWLAAGGILLTFVGLLVIATGVSRKMKRRIAEQAL